jgi:hypothetical protein
MFSDHETPEAGIFAGERSPVNVTLVTKFLRACQPVLRQFALREPDTATAPAQRSCAMETSAPGSFAQPIGDILDQRRPLEDHRPITPVLH